MKISIIYPGKIKDDYIKKGIEKYKKMLTGKVKFELISVKDETISKKSEIEKALKIEGERIKNILVKYDYSIVLDEKGKNLDSIAFSKFIDKLKVSGKSRIAIVIGSALGLSEDIKKESNYLLSVSPMTLPHQIAMLVMSEQIFRSVKISNGETYHY